MNTARQKFTFDTEFLPEGERLAPSARARQKKTLTEAEIEGLRQEARAEGEAGAAVRNGEAIERNIAALTISVRAALDSAHADIEAVRAEAAAIALSAARRLAPAAIAALPQADVEAALREAMHQAIGEPRLVLRAAPAITELLAPRLDALAHEEGYDGRIQLSPDPHFAGGDCRIEWRGGGAERSLERIEAALAQLIEQRFSQFSPAKG